MADPTFAALLGEFQEVLSDCRRLYLNAGRTCARQCPHLLPGSPEDYVLLLDSLHTGLLLKVFFLVAQADMVWSERERQLGKILCEHIWREPVPEAELNDALLRVGAGALDLKWYALIRPFDVMPPLRERVGELETVVMRLANLVAKIDGTMHPSEQQVLRSIQNELERHLRFLPLDTAEDQPSTAAGVRGGAPARSQGRAALAPATLSADDLLDEAPVAELRRKTISKLESGPDSALAAGGESPESLESVLAELEQLIGLDEIKREVRTMANFLRIQQQRKQLGLPETPVALHLVFRGNPGTGKTTVARLIGRIYQALGVLKKGHVVETDRSGMVAEYAGQTGPKSNRKFDEALDGILFIDEAYSLISSGKEDPYGREAVQTLLKRMEDDRHRAAVILAGYPEPLDKLLESNPGLQSRFSNQLTFADYTPPQLGRIFASLCEQNHYRITGLAQARLLLGLNWLYHQRDEHFGNGRLVRNLFERAIRRLANRISGVLPLTRELLTTFESTDLELPNVPEDDLRVETGGARFRTVCTHCRQGVRIPAERLGCEAACPKCGAALPTSWGELVS